MRNYLENSQYIDWEHAIVREKARALSAGMPSDEDITRRCFEFVRDFIQHSWDHRKNPVTCKASDVLLYGTGYCYAKSHLLAALLRANGIPAGLCYQRLSAGASGPPYCLHGLNAVYLRQYGWYRLDARGNKLGVAAEFCPPVEKLAFAVMDEHERDFSEIWHEPLPCIIKALTENETVEQVAGNLPDIEVIRTATPRARMR